MNAASTGCPVVVVLPSAQRRGAEIQGAELASALRTRGWDARAVAIAPGAGTAAINVPVLGGTRWSLRGLMALRRSAKNSLLVAHGSSALLAVGLATIGMRSRWVYRSIGDPNAWVSGWAQRLRTGFLLRRAEAVVVLWPGAEEAMVSTYRVKRGRIITIPNHRDPDRFAPIAPEERETARGRLGVGGPVVLFLGALSVEKGPLDAVTAVAGIDAATLLVVGEGPLAEEVRRLGERLAPGRVRLHGPTDDPGGVLAAADVLVLTSHTEGMPGVIIEALMRGVPVIATDVGAVRSMIADGVNGYVVPVGDTGAMVNALRKTLDEQAGGPLASAFSSAARRTYSPAIVLDRWETLLSSLTER